MKKPKLSLNFGDGGFQGWLVRHCEKMILVAIAGAALWIIWGGYGLTGLDSGKTPDKLQTTAQSKRSRITSTSWDDIKKTRELPIITQEEVKSTRVAATDYPLTTRWNRADFPQWGKRLDPEIFVPISLRGVPIVGPLAYNASAGFEDPLAPPAEKSGKGPRRPPATKARPAAAAAPAGGAGPGLAAAGMPGADLLGGPGMDGMAPGADGMLGAEGMPGMDMMQMGSGAPAAQAVSSSYQAPMGSIPQTRRAVVVMGVVQHEKQWYEFQKKFEEAQDPNPLRDQPTYLTFFAQRVDVTDDPSVDPAAIPDDAWKSINANASLSDAAKWAGFPRDILDPNYLIPVDPYAEPAQRIGLTHPLPPFVQRDLWEAMTHPDIPLASARQIPFQSSPTEEAVPGGAEDDAIPGIPGGAGSGAARGAGMAAMPGMGGAMPGMGGAMPGMGGAMPGMGGAMPGMGGAMPGMGGAMPGMGGAMMGGSSRISSVPQAKYLMIRMTDFSVEPGRKYRYRMKVVLDDPNNPRLSPPPMPAALDPTVTERLVSEGKNKYVSSKDWSAPTDVISLPGLERFYAGKVESDVGQVLVSGTRPVRREPTATTLAVVHDQKKAADVPKEVTVYRGSTINLKTEVEIAHPVTGMLLPKEENYVLRTDAVVADMLGGETIPLINRDRTEKMTTPGELLIIDRDGNLIVQDESQDFEEYRRYVPKKEEKPAPGSGTGEEPPGGADMGMGLIPGAEAAPGTEMPTKRGRRNK